MWWHAINRLSTRGSSPPPLEHHVLDHDLKLDSTSITNICKHLNIHVNPQTSNLSSLGVMEHVR